MHRLLDGLDKSDVDLLAERAAAARKIVYDATGGEELRREIVAAYRELKAKCGGRLSVAVRSSATAEDLPNASFAGQHDSYLNVRGEAALIEACRHCFASIFTDRAIGYRLDNGFDHFKVALSVAVMKMVRSDIGSSGVIFTLDTETGFRDVVFVTGGYGLGENIVQGAIDPDEFYVHKPTYRKGFRTVLRRRLGAKQLRMTYGADPNGRARTRNRPTSKADRERFCLSDQDVLALAGHAISIEDHYSLKAGRPDANGHRVGEGRRGRGSRTSFRRGRRRWPRSRAADRVENYSIKGSGAVLVTGRAVGEKIATGVARVISSARRIWTPSSPARCWWPTPPRPTGSRS